MHKYDGIKFILDLIFPRFCLGCRKELGSKQASQICEACFGKITLNGTTCHVCGSRSVGVCRRCAQKTNLSGVFAAGKYEDAILREAIHQFKYQSVKSLKRPLAELLIKYIKKENLGEKFAGAFLTPIPLSRFKKLKRGFNQSELLAKELSSFLNCPVIHLLKRQKQGVQQAKIADWQKRKENVAGAFVLNDINNLPPKISILRIDGIDSLMNTKIVLVDDVATSGATIEEAARVLKEAGAKEIYGLVVAKG